MLKKQILLILTGILILVLCACGGKTETTAAPTTAAPTTVAPTTAVPTTAAPTTVAPTTAVPTTVAPATVPATTLSGHTFADATCTIPKTCVVCGATEGEAQGHQYVDATCTAPKNCAICGVTEGNALGHNWKAASCVEAKTCTACGAAEGDPLGHSPVIDAAVEPSCTNAGKTEGSHCATCNEILVSQTEIAAVSHEYEGNACRLCGRLKEGMEYLLDAVPPYSTPYWYKSDAAISMGGQTYFHGFTCMGYENAALGNETYVNLNGKYATLSFVAGIVQNNQRGKPVTFTIYADGEIIYYFEMQSNALPEEHLVNVSGCKQLLIAISDGYGVANGSGTYGLGNIIVSETGTGNTQTPEDGAVESGAKYLLNEAPPYSTPYWYNAEGVIKMGGEIYTHGFTCMGYGEEPVGNEILFDLNGKYNKISFVSGIVTGNQKGRNVVISLYADGKLIYSTEMEPNSLPTEHIVDVSDCNQLKIAVYDGYWVANGSGTYGIAEIIVQ